jgi:hypothetical protein
MPRRSVVITVKLSILATNTVLAAALRANQTQGSLEISVSTGRREYANVYSPIFQMIALPVVAYPDVQATRTSGQDLQSLVNRAIPQPTYAGDIHHVCSGELS